MAKRSDKKFTGRAVILPSEQEMAIRRNYESRSDPSIPKRIASGRGGYAMTAAEAAAAASVMDRSVTVSPLTGLPAKGVAMRDAASFFGAKDDFGPWAEYLDDTESGYDYQNLSSTPYDAKAEATMRAMTGEATSREPAPLSLIPTATTNPDRPRTVAAGYDPARKALTVVFRDGTYYNYYSVTEDVWQEFKQAPSKGEFIYLFLNGKPRGTANMAGVDLAARQGAYRIARTGQWVYDGQLGGPLGGQTDRTVGTPTSYASGRIDPTRSKKSRRRK